RSGHGGIFPGVAGDEAAENDAAMKVHAVEHGLHDFPTNIFEIDINAVGSGGSKVLLPAGVFVVDGGVKAELVLDPLAFVVAAGDPNDAAAVNFADLAYDAAGGASGRGDDQGFAGLRLADFEKAEIGGEAVDAEKAEKIGVGEEGNGRKFLEGAGFLAGNENVVLKASEAGNLVTLFEVGRAGSDDFGEAEGEHDATESDGRHVLRDVGHPNAHGGINGEIFDAGEGLAILEGGKSGLGELEIGWRNEASGTGDEFRLTYGIGHGDLREKSSGGEGEKQTVGERRRITERTPRPGRGKRRAQSSQRRENRGDRS